MAGKNLKLYRGLSSDEFSLATDGVFAQNKQAWATILERRVKSDFKYPQELDRSIISLHKNLRLEYQYFTDTKSIAEGYARKVGGLLVELSVPLKDVLEYFDIEFQNFSRRKRQFEIVYCVKGSILAKHNKRWKLKTERKK
ncbi:hypothetical protein [Bdellovibrio sp. HCB337]|uniref:hypothetical protein n=1 Tax=Bdellovibrio sp. HCB337 TaxID=3394358 RepID=UPI0039A64AAC